MSGAADDSVAGEGGAALPGGAPIRLAERLPELGALWIRFYPRRWPAPAMPWLHLALGTLGPLGEGGPLEVPGGVLEERPDDVLYLPPVPAELRRWRDGLAQEARRGGVRPLAQIYPGDPPPDPCALTVVDPLPLLLDGRLGRLVETPAGATVVWPLIPGLSDGEETWDEALLLLARAGVTGAQPLVPALDPLQRRRLAEGVRAPQGGSEALFEALFHREASRDRDLERAFACRARRVGVEPFFHRPGLSLPGRTARNRELAGLLATAAELWLRLGRAPTVGQGLFRAARFVDAAQVDVRALALEGNLGVLGWLDDTSREVVAAWARDGAAVSLLAELRRTYLGNESADAG